jgi:hypothetical protein
MDIPGAGVHTTGGQTLSYSLSPPGSPGPITTFPSTPLSLSGRAVKTYELFTGSQL